MGMRTISWAHQDDETCLLKFKYGKKLAPVVHGLGYPSKSNLRRWIRSWEAGAGAKELIRHKPRYSDEQKQVAGEHYLNHGCCLAFTSRTLDYPCSDVLAGLMNFIPTDDVYLPVRPIRMRPLNQKSNVRQSWSSVHDENQSLKSPDVLMSAVLYCIDEIIGNSAYQTIRKHNELSLEAERDALREEVARLNQEIGRQQMALGILKKAEEIIKKPRASVPVT
ncbi:hypothetical protein C3984_01219 [Escherichia coli]|nr:hypothetical protein C3984_01219 [Escherichia coli]